MELTYQQILAEQYEENAKNLLVYQQEYENDEEDVDEYDPDTYNNNDLPEKEEFNKFHGDRNKPEHVIKPKADTDKDFRKKTRVKTKVVNVDGKFRGGIVPTNPTTCNGLPDENSNPGTSSSYFVFYPSRPYKNITSIKLTSMEFPNTFYVFEYATRENTVFSIVEQTPDNGLVYDYPHPPIIVSDGNYSTADDLVGDIQQLLPIDKYEIKRNPRSNLITISSIYIYPGETSPRTFTLEFPSTPTVNPNGNGIGYNLGFQQLKYTGQSSYTAETVPDVFQDTYVYLSINDYNLIEHPEFGQNHFEAFAKITLPASKNTIVYDNNYTNSTSKEYHFQQPTNINRLEIKLLDAYGNTLDLKGASFSMSLELQEVLDSGVYEKLLEL